MTFVRLNAAQSKILPRLQCTRYLVQRILILSLAEHSAFGYSGRCESGGRL